MLFACCGEHLFFVALCVNSSYVFSFYHCAFLFYTAYYTHVEKVY